MECPRCGSIQVYKNGRKNGKQNHLCVACGRQFIDVYDLPKRHSELTKQECLELYLSGLGFREIARLKGISHSTVFYWIKQFTKPRKLETSDQDACN
jgi:transposase-like protein